MRGFVTPRGHRRRLLLPSPSAELRCRDDDGVSPNPEVDFVAGAGLFDERRRKPDPSGVSYPHELRARRHGEYEALAGAFELTHLYRVTGKHRAKGGDGGSGGGGSGDAPGGGGATGAGAGGGSPATA